jgi:hypothetical protein
VSFRQRMFDEMIPTLPESITRVKHLFERGGLGYGSGEEGDLTDRDR